MASMHHLSIATVAEQSATSAGCCGRAGMPSW